MKSYLGLIPISAHVHRRQSRMTRICIILAVFLVTSIFSMAEMFTRAELESMRNKHGDWHIALCGITEETAARIIENEDIAFSEWKDADREDADEGYDFPQFYIKFKSERGLKKKIDGVKRRYNLSDANVRENTGVLLMLGASSNGKADGLYPLAAACFVIILAAGVFMISSCMNSNVAQRTKFFGMLRCIGASRQQIVRFVRFEALNWCKTAIPIGCLSGVAVCQAACVLLKLLVKGEFADMPLFAVSMSGILCGAAVGVITVLFAAAAPARKAAAVPPVAAVSGNADKPKNITNSANTRLFKVEISLGVRHATEAKKNLFLMTGSFALTIALFMVFSGCFDLVHRLLPSESDFSPDLVIASAGNDNSLDKSLVGRIREIQGVSDVIGTMYAVAIPAKINGDAAVVDLISYDEYMWRWAEKSIINGEMSKAYGDSGYAMTVFAQDSRLDVGDRIELGSGELEIACVASEGIGSVSGSAVVVCSEETFERLVGAQGYMAVYVVLEKGASEETVDKIRRISGDGVFSDRREEMGEMHSSYWVFRIAAYGFLAIISLITVLNIMNSISMSVFARTRQYGAMRAVGMESRQVTRMIAAEAAAYAVCGMAVGLVLGLAFHYLIYEKLIITHFGGVWNVPFAAVASVFLLVFVSCVVAVYAPAKRIGGMVITDVINE